MRNKLKKIDLSGWIMISMVLGLIVGLFLNFCVTDPFIKNIVLINNVFYLGGNGFIRLMKMLVVPLVFCSIVIGAASLSDIRKIGTIGGRVIIIYILTTAVAVSIALFIGSVIQPGIGLNMATNSTVTSQVALNQTAADTL